MNNLKNDSEDELPNPIYPHHKITKSFQKIYNLNHLSLFAELMKGSGRKNYFYATYLSLMNNLFRIFKAPS